MPYGPGFKRADIRRGQSPFACRRNHQFDIAGLRPSPVISQTPTSPAAQPSLSYDELKAQFEGYYEYQNQWGLDAVNASAAYARGATGLGITIGITDSGLDNTHTEISLGRLSGDSDLSYSNYTPNTRQQRHGTMVASVAAGKQEKTEKAKNLRYLVLFVKHIVFYKVIYDLCQTPNGRRRRHSFNHTQSYHALHFQARHRRL